MRILLSLAAAVKFEIDQLNVEIAFHLSELKDVTIYMEQPEGFVEP